MRNMCEWPHVPITQMQLAIVPRLWRYLSKFHCARSEWLHSLLLSSENFCADAAKVALRALAARIRHFRCGLFAELRRVLD